MTEAVTKQLNEASRLVRVLRRGRPYRWPLVGSALLAAYCIVTIVRRAGGPALPLDDAFIHLQFAQRLADGHPFSFTPGGSYSSGATSWLWPASFAPWFWMGIDGLDIIWVVWSVGGIIHAALALETYRVARGLGGEAAGRTAAAMCLVFGAYAWFAYSGMETNALAWLLMRTVRVASELSEHARPSVRARWHLAVLGLLAPMLRPEGALAALIALVALGRVAWLKRDRLSFLVVLPLIGPLIMPSAHLIATGQMASATAQVKWLLLDPYLSTAQRYGKIAANVKLLASDLLNGGPWTSRFLPRGFVCLLSFGMLAMASLARRRARAYRAGFVAVVIFGTAVVCSYDTMLWNRVRYIWPFAASWFVAICCLPVAVGQLLAGVQPVLRTVSPAFLGGLIAWLGVKLPGAVDDLAQSARAIHLQQVHLGQWADRTLPPDALIGVNDTGAIAYLSHRRTFDVVGLTTEGEAKYWAAGAGSRFEHYERLGKASLPTHFIVYPSWIGMTAILGPRLTEATVMDQSILGSKTMVAYEARYDLLNSGSRPFTSGFGKRLVDELDVADLLDEQSHRYQLGDARASFDRVQLGSAPDGRALADGGRLQRAREQFELSIREAVNMVMRTRSEEPLWVWSNGKRLGEATVLARTDEWEERAIPLPAAEKNPRVIVVQAAGGARFASYHYWWFAREEALGEGPN